MGSMDISVLDQDGVVVARPEGRVDSATSGEFEHALMERIEGGARRVVIDCERLTYISSAGLRVVLVAGKRLRAAGGALALCNLSRQIDEVFQISGFATLFPVHASLEKAVAGLSDGG